MYTVFWDLQKYQSGVYRVIKHLVFWIVFVTGYGLAYGSFHDDYAHQLVIQLIHAPEKAIVVYLVIYWVLPNLLDQPVKWPYVLWFLGFMLMGAFLHWLSYLLIEVPMFSTLPADFSILYSIKLFKGIFYIYPVVGVAVAIKLFQYFYQKQQETQALAQEKLQAELQTLKAQVHPHFLFNTLNNLYGLSLKGSEKAPEMVLRLSALLDYILYECNAPLVPIQKELDLVKDYIELERLRYGARLKIDLNISGDVVNRQISPLLLLPFVENAFKHGVSGQTGEAWVKISVTVRGNNFTLSVENSKHQNGVKDQQGYAEGIGIKNVQRRLQLQYPNRHLLHIENTTHEYKVTLEIELAHEIELPSG